VRQWPAENRKTEQMMRPRLRDVAAPVVTRAARPSAPGLGRYSAQVLAELARQTRFVDPNLAADWSRIVGADFAALCRPGRLSGGRSGRTLEIVATSGAAASRLHFEAEAIRRKVNEYLGPGAVARIAVRQAGAKGPDSDDGKLDAALGRFRAAVTAKKPTG